MRVWTKRKGEMSKGNRKKDGGIDNNRAGTHGRWRDKQSVSDGKEKVNEYQVEEGRQGVNEITECKLVKQVKQEEDQNQDRDRCASRETGKDKKTVKVITDFV